MKGVAALAFGFAVAATSFSGAVGAQITVTEIPPLGPDMRCSAETINEPGQVLVRCIVSATGQLKVSVWSSKTNQHTEVVAAAVNNVFPAGLNNLGQAAVWGCGSFDCKAFVWSPDQGAVALVGASSAHGLNDLGEVIVGVPNRGLNLRLTDGNFVPLPSGWQPAAGSHQALNNLSQVALFSRESTVRFALWSASQGLVELPPVPEIPPNPLAPKGERRCMDSMTGAKSPESEMLAPCCTHRTSATKCFLATPWALGPTT